MPIALLALLACQEPFGTDRHDLEGFRIAALSVRPEGDALVPSPALVVEGRPWSDAPVDLRWYWLDAPDALAGELPAPAATGPAPRLTPGRVLGLVATAADGAERRAFLELGEALGAEEPIVTWEALPLRAAEITAADLTLEARAEVAPQSGPVPPGGFARLTLSPEAPRARWMATDGTFFELDAVTADWAAARLRLDDDEIVAREPLEPGLVTVLGLALGEAPAWTAIDLPVGDPGPGAWVGGRFLPAEEPVRGEVLATLVADDRSPTGLRLAEVAPLDGAAWGTTALPCAGPVDGPFDPTWLFDGRCARADVVGARVGLRADP